MTLLTVALYQPRMPLAKLKLALALEKDPTFYMRYVNLDVTFKGWLDTRARHGTLSSTEIYTFQEGRRVCSARVFFTSFPTPIMFQRISDDPLGIPGGLVIIRS